MKVKRIIVSLFRCFVVSLLIFLVVRPVGAQGVKIGEWFKLGEKGINEVFRPKDVNKCINECCKNQPSQCNSINAGAEEDHEACYAQCTGVPIGSFISSILPNIYTIAGIILLFLLIFGGFTYIVNAGKQDTEGVQKGKNAITAAVIGFALIFGSWWIIQIIEIVTGIDILK